MPSVPTTTTAAASTDLVDAVEQPLRLGQSQVVVLSFQEEHRTKAVSPVDSVWLVVNLEITNLGAHMQRLTPQGRPP